MRFIILFSIVLMSIVNVYGQNLSKLDEKNGFKNFKLGSLKSNYPNLVYYGFILSELDDNYSKEYDGYLDHSLKSYVKRNDDVKIGDIEISEPTYYFFNNKLLRIDFTLLNSNGKELLKLYTSLYGSPVVKKERNSLGAEITNYVWKGKRVNLIMTYCGKPFKSNTIYYKNGSPVDDTPKDGPKYTVRYVSLEGLAQKSGGTSADRAKLNQQRANDL
ncbi:hypothetical protein [uncultured Pontibacter sp.]|uniref:hypothetical protein n=1 Tax=uncultured Pontibacter sp. TaxID=453356 RepID=UPI002631240E|nr:hypothetical protein [uncultured Pontibacter sp.]